MDLLFVPQMLHESRQPQWNAVDSGKPKNSWEKPVPVPLCPPQIPHGLTRARTRASAARDWRPTSWSMARPRGVSLHYHGCVSSAQHSRRQPFSPAVFVYWDSWDMPSAIHVIRSKEIIRWELAYRDLPPNESSWFSDARWPAVFAWGDGMTGRC
jgi:hypothetical protein